MLKRVFAAVIAAFIVMQAFSACSGSKPSEDMVTFVDSAGRSVSIPKDITRVAPSGAVATMFLSTIAPEYMVSIASTPSSFQYKYLPANLIELPTTGQMYGSRSTINLEALLTAKPQLIIDLGDKKENIGDDMDGLQKQCGIPVIFIEANLPNMAQAYRSLGSVLSGKAERGEEIASFIDETISMANANASKIPESERIRVAYTSGTSGLDTNAAGSTQAQVIDIVGAINAIVVEDVSDRGGGNTINLEQMKNFDPDVILFTTGSVYETAADDPAWSLLTAINRGRYYEIPGMPYNWMSNPPSINMILGIWWLGNLLYPDVYDYNMTAAAQRCFKIFWGYDLTDDEAEGMLFNI